MKIVDLIVDAKGPEIQHRSGLTAPDPFIYLKMASEAKVFFDAREYDTQKKKIQEQESSVMIERLEPWTSKAKGVVSNPLYDALLVILSENQVEVVNVPENIPFGLVKVMEEHGIRAEIYDFAKERQLKTDEEISKIIEAQRVNEAAFSLVWEILAKSKIRGKQIVYQGEALTSELVKVVLKKFFLDKGYDSPDGMIVACGKDASQPHNEGSGCLLANQSIIIDLFPRSEKTGFYADMTRTFVKGQPSEKLSKIIAAVEEVQKKAADRLKVGGVCAEFHASVVRNFQELGYESSPERGFMHGTGHSLGLALHENPRLNHAYNERVGAGMVFTVEPGLYYPEVGGVRIEDIVVFYPDGKKENITKFNKPAIIP